MTRLSIAEELESAANRIADISRPDLQIILRRASLMLGHDQQPCNLSRQRARPGMPLHGGIVARGWRAVARRRGR
ncbi:MAG: hypothetical protein E5Y63_31545 [Mesorhizobium sp.]|nr:MAG: hypothetical protein EOR04_19670 [Mesorhizobium sp.]RWP56496.1 MAG: hypothetical protein EOR08_33035 [Mesorhizobium sp.]TIM26034.1 MAG: hypothetical protein E5Y63_31545 [Mesorhizobium sp.]TIM78522.1 MAG: hypothetical protein E5Y58_02925 [Mesorhizobium sp.]